MTPPERPPERPATILRSDELRQLRQAESILRDAETARRDSETAAAAEAQSVLTEARQKALRDSARTAARLIAQAEAKAQERLVGLEPELARLVANTVRQIVGDFAREEATYHAALTALRQRKHEDIDQEDVLEIADQADTPEASLNRSNTSEILRACVAKLSPAHREIINLVYYHEKSVEEAGAIIGIPQSTVKTRMFYARKQLADLLQGEPRSLC